MHQWQNRWKFKDNVAENTKNILKGNINLDAKNKYQWGMPICELWIYKHTQSLHNRVFIPPKLALTQSLLFRAMPSQPWKQFRLMKIKKIYENKNIEYRLGIVYNMKIFIILMECKV